MALDIHAMSKGDKDAITEILHATPEFNAEEIAVAEEVIESYLREPYRSGYHIFVAHLDTSIAGYICYGPTPMTMGTWDIYWIAVRPDRQCVGIGRALMAFAEREMNERNGRLAIVETSSKSSYEKTRRFYYGLGYQAICRIADFYSPGDDKVILQKNLLRSGDYG